MPKVVARIKAKGKQYEIHVDLDEALKVKQGKGDIISAIDSDFVYYDLNKGAKASNTGKPNDEIEDRHADHGGNGGPAHRMCVMTLWEKVARTDVEKEARKKCEKEAEARLWNGE